MKDSKQKPGGIPCACGLGILILLEWILQRKIPFMMDDLWYGTNLATGEPLKQFGDVIVSQIWHYHNWGGRSITHGVLQLTLMSGELFADIFNLIMALILAWMICRIADEKNLMALFGAFSMLAAFNANLKMSMFWQAGTVNYVYSSVWILLFVQGYIRLLDAPSGKTGRPVGDEKKGILLLQCVLWVLLGFITGWSNENMGPASFVLSVFVIAYYTKTQGKRPQLFWILGSVACLAGSVIMLLAPGNFVRKDVIEPKTLFQTLYDRFFSMLEAGGEFLFPVVALMTVLVLLYCIYLKKNPGLKIWVLMGYALLSYGAMILSPHYPDRATFGTMVVCILVIIELSGRIIRENTRYNKYFLAGYASIWIYAVYKVMSEISYAL